MMGGRRTLSMMVLLKLIIFWTTSPGESLTIKPMTIPTKKKRSGARGKKFCVDRPERMRL
jgi:hypothetical protein